LNCTARSHALITCLNKYPFYRTHTSLNVATINKAPRQESVYGKGCIIASNHSVGTPGEGPFTSIKHDAGWNLEPVWMLYKRKKSLTPPRNQTM